VPHLQVDGSFRNVVFVATEHDGLYAFDADARPCHRLWKASLIDWRHGGLGGESTVPSGVDRHLIGQHYGDITPEVGVTGTPVIDPASDTLYVVSKSVIYSLGLRFHERLHAIDLATGDEKPGSPVTIAATFARNGHRTLAFDPRTENQRAGLALVDGTVYVAFASHEDEEPFYGWLIGYRYDGASFMQTNVFNVEPDAQEGGIWMGGVAPAADRRGDLYVTTSNGRFDAASPTPPNDDYGDSLLRLSKDLKPRQYFTPSDQQLQFVQNNEFGSGGVVLVDLPEGSRVTHLVIAGGKDGALYVLDRDALGGYGDARAWQKISAGTETDLSGPNPGVVFSEGAFWNGHYYLAGAGEPLKEYRLDPTTARLVYVAAASQPAGGFAFPGATPSISAAGDSNGIVWALDNRAYCTPASQGCGPAVLHAYDAATLRELWNSSMRREDAAGNAVKFTVPTIAAGRVYVGTRGNNTGDVYGSTSVSGELDVYGLRSGLAGPR
jgi:outer membrane protein assembly factor BamB